MTEEKILYFAEKGTYIESCAELKYNDYKFKMLYDMVHNKKYLTWKSLYSTNVYEITILGKLRLYLYRLNYAKKNEPMSYENRLLFLKDAVKMYPNEAEILKNSLGTKNRKLFNKAFM